MEELWEWGLVDCSCPSTEPEILGIFPLNQSSLVRSRHTKLCTKNCECKMQVVDDFAIQNSIIIVLAKPISDVISVTLYVLRVRKIVNVKCRLLRSTENLCQL